MTTDTETKIGALAGAAVLIIAGIAWTKPPPPAATRPKATPPTTLNMRALMRAHALAESSGSNPRPYWDRKQHSWGRYSFGVARWTESGGSRDTWGTASLAEQDRIMELALRRYLRNLPLDSSADDAVIWTANWHNRGSGSLKRTKHTDKVLRYYRKEVSK